MRFLLFAIFDHVFFSWHVRQYVYQANMQTPANIPWEGWQHLNSSDVLPYSNLSTSFCWSAWGSCQWKACWNEREACLIRKTDKIEGIRFPIKRKLLGKWSTRGILKWWPIELSSGWLDKDLHEMWKADRESFLISKILSWIMFVRTNAPTIFYPVCTGHDFCSHPSSVSFSVPHF